VWQRVAPYSSRRHSQDFACLREAASAKAGAPRIWAFLSILIKITFSTICFSLEYVKS
jgi:hypothetical protein